MFISNRYGLLLLNSQLSLFLTVLLENKIEQAVAETILCHLLENCDKTRTRYSRCREIVEDCLTRSTMKGVFSLNLRSVEIILHIRIFHYVSTVEKL